MIILSKHNATTITTTTTTATTSNNDNNDNDNDNRLPPPGRRPAPPRLHERHGGPRRQDGPRIYYT